MIPVAEALDRLAAAAGALDVVEERLDRALGRTLAEPVVADRDFPPTDRSAMDGFALRSGDAARRGAELRLVGELRAGQPVGDLRTGTGEAVQVFTGAIVPPGADAVVRVEDTEFLDGGRFVRVGVALAPGDNVRPRGVERRCGEQVLEPGRVIGAPEIAALAAIGCTRPRVHRMPVVHIVSTGDELVDPEVRPAEHEIRESNGRALGALLAATGIRAARVSRAADRERDLEQALGTGLGADVLLVSGGVSVGTYDLVRVTLERLGVEILFHGVAMKPGKPVLAGRRGGCLVLGLPGNPVSACVVFVVLAAPVLRRMMGRTRWRNVTVDARLTAALPGRPGLETYVPARIDRDGEGFIAAAVPSTGSGDLLSLVRANGLLVRPATVGALEAGARLAALPWRVDDDLG